MTRALSTSPDVGRATTVRARTFGLATLGGAVAGSALLLARPPLAGAYPGCPWLALTGLDCPLCGGTRCVAALLHGDVTAAVDYNLLAAVVVPALLIVALIAAVAGPRAQRLVDVLFAPRTLRVALVVVSGWFVLRLLPVVPWLASGT